MRIVSVLMLFFIVNAISPFSYALDTRSPSSTSAADIKKTAKVITVAKKGGDYKTISAALTAIKDASAANPYVIKVMPGIYEESIQMKQYVDLIGSGLEDTKITSSDVFAVMGADSSTLENIWVDSTMAIAGKYQPSAILNDGTSMTINNVKVTINNPVPPLSQAFGIQTRGPASKPIISNCIVLAKGTNQRGLIGIGGVGSGSEGSSPAITNCIITVDTSGATNSFWNVGIRTREGKATVNNSTIKVIGAEYNQGIEGVKSIYNSRIEVIGTPNTVSNIGIEYAHVTDSEVIIEGTSTQTSCAISNGSIIERSMIDGPICDKRSKIVNCRDKNNKPIPNQ